MSARRGGAVTGVILALLATACQSPSGPSAPASAPPVGGLPTPPAAGWPTYQRDPSRSGVDASLPPIRSLRRDWESIRLDGDVYAQPLVAGDLVLVATEGDSVYALDASTGRIRWRAHLGEPVPRSALPCGNIDPTGITGTPVVDPAGGVVYAAAFVQPGRHVLFALDLGTGAVRFQRAIDPAGSSPLVLQQRAALTFSQGTVFVAFGGLFGDCGAYNGWVVAVPASGTGPLRSYRVPAGRGAGIWAPAGPSVDGAGDLFVATGNSESRSTFDFGNSVIRLSADLRMLDWFAPTNWADLNGGDTDLGSTGPTLLPDDLVFQVGKSGVGYLVRANHLGGIGGQVASLPVCSGAYGGTAVASPFVYVPCLDGLVAVRVGNGSSGPSLRVAWRGPSFRAGPPMVAGGSVWTLDTRGGVLYGLDPISGRVRYREAVGDVMHFAAASAGDGRILVPAGRMVTAFIGA